MADARPTEYTKTHASERTDIEGIEKHFQASRKTVGEPGSIRLRAGAALAVTSSRAVGFWRRLLEQMRIHFFFAAQSERGLWPLLRIPTAVAPMLAEGGPQSAPLERLHLPWPPQRFPTLVRAERFAKEG